MKTYYSDEITVREMITHWLTEKKITVRSSTYSNYRALLKPLLNQLGDKPLLELTTEDLQEFVDTLLRQDKRSAARHLMDLLIPILNEAVRDNYISSNPAKTVILPEYMLTEKNVMTKKQQELFLKALQRERLCYLFQFQLYLGLRPGEVIALRWEDVDFDSEIISICHSAKRGRSDHGGKSHMEISFTKTGRMRRLKLTKATMQILLWQRKLQQAEIAKGYYKKTDYIFPSRKGTLLEVNSLNRVLKRVSIKMRVLQAEQLGKAVADVQMPVFTAHCLRHTFATRALEAGIPQKVVADWLGHRTTRTTGDIYSHVLPERNVEFVQSLELYMNEIASLTLME